MPVFEKLSVHKEETSSKVYFGFVGDFHVEDITSVLKINPTYFFNKGDMRRSITKENGQPSYHTFSRWCYGTDYEITFDIEEQCGRIVNMLDNKKSEIIYILQKYDCEAVLQVVSVIENGRVPALHFTQNVIDFCADISAEIDVDIYTNPYNESENTFEIEL